MALTFTLLSLRRYIGTMQPTLSESESLRYHLRLSNPTSSTNLISRFALAPKPWAVFTSSSATIRCNLLTLCSMSFSSIYLPYSRRIFSTILFTRAPMTTPILPIPIYLLSNPMIPPVFLKHFVNTGARLSLSSPKRQHH